MAVGIDAVHARRPKRLPSVLAKEEVHRVLGHLCSFPGQLLGGDVPAAVSLAQTGLVAYNPRHQVGFGAARKEAQHILVVDHLDDGAANGSYRCMTASSREPLESH